VPVVLSGSNQRYPMLSRTSIGRQCSKPVNNPAGDRTVSCYLLGYRPYSFRCPADLRPVVVATSAEKTPILRQTPYGHRPVFGRSTEDVRTESVHVTDLCFRWGELGGTKILRALPMPYIGQAMWLGHNHESGIGQPRDFAIFSH